MAAGALALVAVPVFTMTGLASDLDNRVVDARFHVRGAVSASHDIVLVALDQQSLTYLDARPPIDRSVYAELLDRVHAAGPQALAVDVQFIGKTNPASDEALLAAIDRDGPVVVATHEGADGPVPVPAGANGAAGARPATAAVATDADNVVRRMLLAPVALKTFAVRAAEEFLGRDIGQAGFEDNAAWIAFRGPPGTFSTYSLSDVLLGRVPDSAFAGKLVLIGVTDPVDDTFVTAASSNPMSGLELQANATQTILDGFPLRTIPWPLTALIVVVLIAIPLAIVSRFPALAAIAGSTAAVVTFAILSQLAFRAGWIVPTAPPIVALAVATLAGVAADSFVNARQRRNLERTLGDLLPPPAPAAFFISYRRAQDAWAARDIRADLAARFGNASVFLDTQSINLGEPWPERLAAATRWCSVMLVLVGPSWLQDPNGVRRIDDPSDWVRLEIESVLRRPDVIVIPVLLNGATCPGAGDLPEEVRELAGRQAYRMTGDDLHSEITALLGSIERNRIHNATTAPVPG